MIGPLKESKSGYRYAIMMVDHFSKWPIATGIKRKTPGIVVQKIKELLIEKLGIPKKIISDNDLEFANNESRILQRCTK